VITDSSAAKPAIPVVPDPLDPNPENLSTKGKATSKPANENEVITDSDESTTSRTFSGWCASVACKSCSGIYETSSRLHYYRIILPLDNG
jgi:hypothetical protein